MDYWDETMQDDMYLIAAEGWVDAARPRLIVTKKKATSGEKAIKETPDLTVDKRKYKMDLLPPALVMPSTETNPQDNKLTEEAV